MVIAAKDGRQFTMPTNSVDSITFLPSEQVMDLPKIGHSDTIIIEQPNPNSYSLPKCTNVIMIPIVGQSLSLGSASVPVLTTTNKYNTGLMFEGGVRFSNNRSQFVPLVEMKGSPTNDSANTGETVASGCVEGFVEALSHDMGIDVYDDYWQSHQLMFVTCGSGSKTIQQIIDTYIPTQLVPSIQSAKQICDTNGWTISVPAIIYMQGETDQKQNIAKDTYKEQLQRLQFVCDSIATDVLNEEQYTKVILYQIASQNIVGQPTTPTFTSTAMNVPTAQMEVIRDDDKFLASAPVYILDHSQAEPIHLSAEGERLLGFYCGNTLADLLFRSKHQKGVMPYHVYAKGNKTIVEYNVEYPPLRADTTWVTSVANHGFAILNSQGINIVSSVNINETQVVIDCTQSPMNAHLFYAFNGTRGKDGRQQGSRGNLCDSKGFHYTAQIGEFTQRMHNYAYAFDGIISEEIPDDSIPIINYEKIYSPAEATIREDVYLSSNGITEYPLSAFIIAEIDVTDVDGVKAYGYCSTIMCGLVFKDDNGNILGSVHVPSETGYNTFEADKPAGATKAYCSFSVYGDRTYDLQTYIKQIIE